MSKTNSISRRRFVAGASSLVLVGAAAGAAENAASNQRSELAVHGGEKADKAFDLYKTLKNKS